MCTVGSIAVRDGHLVVSKSGAVCAAGYCVVRGGGTQLFSTGLAFNMKLPNPAQPDIYSRHRFRDPGIIFVALDSRNTDMRSAVSYGLGVSTRLSDVRSPETYRLISVIRLQPRPKNSAPAQ